MLEGEKTARHISYDVACLHLQRMNCTLLFQDCEAVLRLRPGDKYCLDMKKGVEELVVGTLVRVL